MHDLERSLVLFKFWINFNIGTELRLGFGKSIRQILADDGEVFDRIQILKQVEPDLQAAAQFALRGIAAAKN